MKKLTVLVGLFLLVGLFSEEASAGIFGRRRYAPRTTITTSPRIVDEFPAHGSIKIKNGWYYEFHQHDAYNGTWYPSHPVGEPAGDYQGGQPVDGAVRYKNGLRWTFDGYRGVWVSEWH